jgi:hypothetical protein
MSLSPATPTRVVRGELLKRLEASSLRVCIDYRDFQPGAPSVAEMERAVLTSHKICSSSRPITSRAPDGI